MSLNAAPPARQAAAGARTFSQLVKSEVLKTGGVERATHETHTPHREGMWSHVGRSCGQEHSRLVWLKSVLVCVSACLPACITEEPHS